MQPLISLCDVINVLPRVIFSEQASSSLLLKLSTWFFLTFSKISYSYFAQNSCNGTLLNNKMRIKLFKNRNRDTRFCVFNSPSMCHSTCFASLLFSCPAPQDFSKPTENNTSSFITSMLNSTPIMVRISGG